MEINKIVRGSIFLLTFIGCAQNTPSVTGSTVSIDGLEYQNQPFTKEYTFQEATKYCSSISMRLPTVSELDKVSNVKIEGAWTNQWEKWFADNKKNITSNSLGKQHFVKSDFSENMTMTNSSFWSSEEDKENKNYASSVYFNKAVNASDVKSTKNHVLCVN
jgi:hypothetical protein